MVCGQLNPAEQGRCRRKAGLREKAPDFQFRMSASFQFANDLEYRGVANAQRCVGLFDAAPFDRRVLPVKLARRSAEPGMQAVRGRRRSKLKREPGAHEAI